MTCTNAITSKTFAAAEATTIVSSACGQGPGLGSQLVPMRVDGAPTLGRVPVPYGPEAWLAVLGCPSDRVATRC